MERGTEERHEKIQNVTGCWDRAAETEVSALLEYQVIWTMEKREWKLTCGVINAIQFPVEAVLFWSIRFVSHVAALLQLYIYEYTVYTLL